MLNSILDVFVFEELKNTWEVEFTQLDNFRWFFSEFPSFTRNTQPQKSSSNVLECRVLDSIVSEIFLTRYLTQLDSIFVEEVWPSAN